MEKFYQTESDPKQLSPLTLAYVGDGVYELFVREYIVSKGNCPVKKLHSRAVSHVPKNSSVADYHAATAFECVFGYLYLKGELERLRLFFDKILEFAETEETAHA